MNHGQHLTRQQEKLFGNIFADCKIYGCETRTVNTVKKRKPEAVSNGCVTVRC